MQALQTAESSRWQALLMKMHGVSYDYRYGSLIIGILKFWHAIHGDQGSVYTGIAYFCMWYSVDFV